MRVEMRKIRESIDRESVSRNLPVGSTTSHEVPKARRSPPEKSPPVKPWSPSAKSREGESWPPLVPENKKRKMETDTEWVLRPPIQGRSALIPVREDLPFTSRGSYHDIHWQGKRRKGTYT